jgi:hypothetical protein
MDESHRRGHIFWLIIILALGAFFLLYHLDQRPFWQDEAETAGLARNVLKYGVPRAYDGVNIISQEHGREYDHNYLWRWSPWLQIYVAAAAFRLGGLNTYVGRLPFALLGLLCIFLTYQLVNRHLHHRPWALWAAALVAFSVPFLLFARQCRYYSLGTAFTLLSLYAFMSDWQKRTLPAVILCVSIGLLFHTNYLLFFSFVLPALIAAVWLYPEKLPWKRTLLVALFIIIIIFPGFFLFKIEQQSNFINLVTIPHHLVKYFGGLLQFIIPLPIVLYLAWKWRRVIGTRPALPQEPGERFVLFLTLISLGNIVLLSPAPQCEFRYLVHLIPLAAIILGWVILRAWSYYQVAGALLAGMLLLTNWLYIVPMDWLHIINRPMLADRLMLTSPNLPLRLFLTELICGAPDVNGDLIHFFQAHARPGDIILTTYGDLPLQFYTPFQVLGGLQRQRALPRPPDWVVSRWDVRFDRAYQLLDSEQYIKNRLSLAANYRPVLLPCEDAAYGNRPDPYSHHFTPAATSMARLVIYKKFRP